MFYNPKTKAFVNQTITKLKKVPPERIREAYGAAYKDLSKGAYAMYVFATLDNEGFERKWSYSAIRDWCGLSKSTYYDGLQELKRLGYIREEKGIIYFFMESENSDSKKKDSENPDYIKVKESEISDYKESENPESYIKKSENSDYIKKKESENSDSKKTISPKIRTKQSEKSVDYSINNNNNSNSLSWDF